LAWIGSDEAMIGAIRRRSRGASQRKGLGGPVAISTVIARPAAPVATCRNYRIYWEAYKRPWTRVLRPAAGRRFI